MFVTSHTLSGVLIGRAARGRPTAAFLAGVGSHLVLDSVPHWGCEIGDDVAYGQFLRVAKRDGLLGLAVIAAALAAADRRDLVSTIAAITGAVVLDLDKPCKFFFGFNPFPPTITRLHSRVQNESPDGMPKEIAYGSLLAMADAVMISLGRRVGGRPGRR
ncbi:MAG: hypothetical protein ACRDYE_14035 [Acidimicrobiales bacterium]